MNLLEIIYLVGALAVGIIFGMIVELFIDNEILVEAKRENDRLKLELEESRRQPEVIEIVDPWAVSSKAPEELSFPNTDGI